MVAMMICLQFKISTVSNDFTSVPLIAFSMGSGQVATAGACSQSVRLLNLCSHRFLV